MQLHFKIDIVIAHAHFFLRVVQRQVAHGVTLVSEGAQYNPLFRLVPALHNAVIVREVGLRVKILVQNERPVGRRHLLDAIEREGEEAAVFQASEQVPAAAEEIDAVGFYRPLARFGLIYPIRYFKS